MRALKLPFTPPIPMQELPDYGRHVYNKLKRTPPLGILLDVGSKFGVQVLPFLLFAEDVGSAPPPPPDLGDSELSVAPLSRDEVTSLADIPLRPFKEEALLERVSRGDLCIGAKQGTQVVAFTWCNFVESSFLGCRFALGPSEAYLYDQFTLPAYRGRGLAPLLRHALYQELQQRGRRRLFSYSDRFNFPAIRFKEKLGAKVVFAGAHIRLANRCGLSTSIDNRQLATIRRRCDELFE